jgi:hypothetical protein
MRQSKHDIEKAVSQALYRHDEKLSDDLYIIKTEQIDQVCLEAAQQILKQEQEAK